MMIYEIHWLFIGLAAGGVFLLLVALFITLFIVKGKKKRYKQTPEFLDSLVQALGNKENIISAKMINGRIHFELKDIELAKLEELKKISNSGIFIANQTIKILFHEDSKAICDAVCAKIKE